MDRWGVGLWGKGERYFFKFIGESNGVRVYFYLGRDGEEGRGEVRVSSFLGRFGWVR